MNNEEYSHRVTRWLSLGNQEFFGETSERIKKNQGDHTCIKTDSTGRVALFRTVNGIFLRGQKKGSIG